jgi:hypothetical protein
MSPTPNGSIEEHFTDRRLKPRKPGKIFTIAWEIVVRPVDWINCL